jgi:antitoxin (DNA-binding transcriptional repressor) of toxin-antitoxin stability system
MKSAKISQFKAELSKYLRYIRRGEEVLILDRETPLARVIPFKQEEDLIIEEALDEADKLFKMRPKSIPGLEDSLKFLWEERGDR